MKIGFIGGGKVGSSIGKYFSLHDVLLSGFYSLNPNHAKEAATFTNSTCYKSIDDLVSNSDIIFCTVTDSSITDVANQIDPSTLRNKILCHCSGALSAHDAFDNFADDPLIEICSVHPLCAICDKENSYKILDKITFFAEGTPKALNILKEIFSIANLNFKVLNTESKVKYHLAASIISNQVVALVDEALTLFSQCGFNTEESLQAISPLFIENANNIIQLGTIQALTGPVQRADAITIEKHLNAIDNLEDKLLYALLCKKLISIAKAKTPSTDFSAVQKLVDKYIHED